MSVNPTYNDRVEYLLQHIDYGSLVVDEPIGWQTDEKELARHEDYHGIFAKFSNNLKFIRDGADYITLIYTVYGINANILLRRRERHPQTNVWEISYTGVLDLSTYQKENNEVSCKFNASGLEQILKSRENEKVEIDRTDTLDGSLIDPLEFQTAILEGRRIFLKTTMESGEDETNEFTTSGAFRSPIMNIVSEMDDRVQPVIEDFIPYTQDSSFQWTDLNPNVSNLFYLNNDRDKTLVLKGHVICGNIPSFTGFINAAIVIVDENNDVVSGQYVYKPEPLINSIIWHDFTFEYEVELEEGQGLMFVIVSQIFPPGSTGTLHTIKYEKIDFSIEENSYFPPTTTKTILSHELGDRLTRIITDRENAFYSEALGRTDIGYLSDGVNTGALNGFSHGFYVRGFDKEPISEDNKFKPLTTSFKDFIQNMKTTFNLGLGIERFGFSERIRVEDLKYFYNNNVLIKLGKVIDGQFQYIRVNNVKRTVATEYYYSSITLGYDKGWDNEEAMGLDEYNTQTRFSTTITRLKNAYESVSTYIAATYAKEFSRRKPKTAYPTTDHAYDRDIFILDLKRGLSGVFEERKYQDDFEQIPTGTFSPETATNLRLTPFNILLRHGWNIASGLQKQYGYLYTKYTSSEGNSSLKTKLDGGNEYAENGDIVNTDFQRPRYFPEWIEFDYQVDFQLMKHIEDSTEILGKKIPNFYGLVEFMNENNELEKGYLFNLKPNGEGKWKILKSNR